MTVVFLVIKSTFKSGNDLLVHGKEGLKVDVAAMITKEKVSSFIRPDFKFSVFTDEGGFIWDAPEGST